MPKERDERRGQTPSALRVISHKAEPGTRFGGLGNAAEHSPSTVATGLCHGPVLRSDSVEEHPKLQKHGI